MPWVINNIRCFVCVQTNIYIFTKGNQLHDNALCIFPDGKEI